MGAENQRIPAERAKNRLGARAAQPRGDTTSNDAPDGGVETTTKSVLEIATRLGKEDLETVLSDFSERGKDSFQPVWLNFCTTHPNAAAKQCFAMRKQGSVAAIASYYLAKTLYHLDNKKNLNVFAWCALNAIKGFQQEARSKKADYRSHIEGIVTELCSLDIQPKSEYDQILIAQIRHYKTVVLASEEHLAAAFEEQRAKYLEHPEDINNLRGLGWTLHDCIKLASETLKSRKLVGFFSDELRRLAYPEAMKSLDEKLVNCFASDLKKAEDFLSGTGEVLALAKGNDLSAALVAAEKLAAEQPENAAAHIALAGIYDKMQRPQEALKEYRLANKIDPENEKAQNGAAWALVRLINEALKAGWLPTRENGWDFGSMTAFIPKHSAFIAEAKNDGRTSVPRPVASIISVEEIFGETRSPDVEESKRRKRSESRVIYRGLSCLSKWKAIKRPSLVYSQLLRAYTRVVKSAGKDVPWSLAEGYLGFVKAWNLANLTDDDRKPFVPQDNPKSSYPSLAEHVVGALYRCAIVLSRAGSPLLKENPWVMAAIAQAVEAYPKQRWFPYYYGKLLVEQGRCEDARGYLIKIAQQKMSEFWVWQVLAETYPDNPDRQLVCLCRAALCKVPDEALLVSVHEMLGALLKSRGMDAEALCEFQKVDAMRAAKNWRAIDRGEDYVLWSQQVTAVRNNGRLYRQWADKADAIVLEHLPSIEAIVTARYTDRERNEEVAKVWWMASGGKREMRVKAQRFPVLRKAVPGLPIRVWIDTVDGRDVLLKAEPREGGCPWDIYPKQPGVLVAQDERRGRSLFVIGDRGETCSVDWRDREDLREMAIGTVGELALFARPDGRREVRHVAFPEDGVLPPFAKVYSGTLCIPEGRSFGFVGEGIFVPEDVLSGIEGGCFVTGIATRSYDRTKNCPGWRAVTLEVKR